MIDAVQKIPSEFQENSLLPKVPPFFQKSQMPRFQMQEGMRMTRWRRAFPRVGQINRWNNERDGETERKGKIEKERPD